VRNNFVHLEKLGYLMKKKNMFCLAAALCLFTLTAWAQEVEISMDHPDQVTAGDIFEVTVTIDKGSLTDYSRFSQDLPLGLTASKVSIPNADFSFDNQRIRIIWLKLPEEPEVKVTYNIKVDDRLKGTLVLGGVFAYVVNEERKFLNFEKSREITILPNPNIDPSMVVDIKDFKGGMTGGGAVAATTPAKTDEVWAMAVRQKPVLLSTGGYLVNLLVKNPKGSKYAKIEETIPSGYLFESVDPHEGIESFSSSTVKFIWMKLPAEEAFGVSYRLVPKRGETQGDMAIKGFFTYSEGSDNKVVEIKEVDVVLASLTEDQQKALLMTGSVPEGARTSQAMNTAPEPERETVTETKPEPKPEPEARQAQPETRTVSQPGAAGGAMIANTKVLTAGTGTYFRVQVAATNKPINGTSEFRNKGVDREVLVEQHQGYYKYTAGSFTDYTSAKNYRDQLVNRRGIHGAFVVAYKDGRRVPISSVQ
jgi:hypothetical protein